MAAEQDVLAEIQALRGRLPHVCGVLVATVDGLLVAHDTQGIEPETMAAMSAAHLGLSQQIANGAAQGDFEEAVTRAANGYTAVFTAGSNALLTVLADAGLNVGRLHHEARPTAARVGELLAAATPRAPLHRARAPGR
jgi:predicted regulator of Ras-like GTPase activity (Roadblock/LC7/MglB family)